MRRSPSRDARHSAQAGLRAARRYFRHYPGPPGADFHAAIRDLERALRDLPGDDPMRVEASFMLGAVRIADHEMRCADPCPAAAEVASAVALLAVGGARDGAPLDQLYPYAMTVDKLYDHTRDPADIDLAIAWLRRAAAHPHVPAGDRRRALISLAIQHANSGAAMRRAQGRSGPGTQSWAAFGAAIEQFEAVLAEHGSPSDGTGDTDRLDARLGLLETYYQRGGDHVPGEDLDVMAALARGLITGMTPGYRLRGHALGRGATLLIQRIMRRLGDPWDRALESLRPEVISEAILKVPGADVDLGLAIGALAQALGLGEDASRQPLLEAGMCAARALRYLAHGGQEDLGEFGRLCRIVMGRPGVDPYYRRSCGEFLLLVLAQHVRASGAGLAPSALSPSGHADLDTMIGLLARFAAVDGVKLDPALSWVLAGAASMRSGGELPDRAPAASSLPSPLEAYSVRALAAPGAASHGRLAVAAGRAAEIAESLLSPPPRRAAEEAAVRSVLALALAARWLRERDHAYLARSIAQLRRAIGLVQDSHPLHAPLAELLARTLLDRAWTRGDHADADAALSLLRGAGEIQADLNTLLAQAGPPALRGLLAARPGPQPRDGAEYRMQTQAAIGSALLLRALLAGGPAAWLEGGPADDLSSAADLLHGVAAALPAGSPLRPDVLSDLGLALMAGGGSRLRSGLATMHEAAAACPPGHPRRAAILLRAAAALAASAHAAYDPQLIGQGIGLLTQALRSAGLDGYAERSRCLYGLGYTMLVRFEHAGHDADLGAAIDALEDARACLEPSPGDPFMVPLLRLLAWAHRRAGPDPLHRGLARSIGRSVLHAHATTVLLQSGSRDAIAAARSIGTDALRLAGWCLADGRDELAVEAIELGRALVLHAATVAADIPALLREANQPELAAEWEATAPRDADDVPGDLRHRMLTALRTGPAERRMLAAPTIAQIAATLRAMRADALIYLVPGSDELDGHAVAVRADGKAEAIRLPGLVTGPGSAVADFAAAHRDLRAAAHRDLRGAGQTEPRARARFRDRLEDLCDWAWTAAVGPLLDRGVAALPQLPRLVIVPVGILGLVPWHAARHPARDRVRYACAEAVLTTCASARQLIEAAARPRVPVSARSAVLVADRSGRLPRSEQEVDGICSVLYPGAVCPGKPGQPGDGPEEILACLSGEVLPGVLHLGCHATAGATPEESRLELAGGELPVGRILVQARGRTPGSPGGLVVLAACTSDLTMTDYDEALTLSSAFLAAGATGVVGSRWAVDDLFTALLMFMLHRHLVMNPGESPADALRAAQLWMLDPRRQAPPEMPRSLAAQARRMGARRPFAWAAFTYHGQ